MLINGNLDFFPPVLVVFLAVLMLLITLSDHLESSYRSHFSVMEPG